ncbi:MAG TPA: imidazole glycerol phosphate synthase subunit HisF [Gaiellales bacterium]
MLRRRIIPCLDVSGGRVVKGVEFVNLRDCGDPVDAAVRYAEQRADEIIWLNITASSESWRALLEHVESAAERVDIPVTVGGGVSRVEHVRELLLAGADKVAINSAALRDPALVERAAEAFGRQCVVVAIDARRSNGSWRVHLDGGRTPTDSDVIEWASEAAARGAGELLVTSMDADGGQSGYDTELLQRIAERVEVPVIASGGAGRPEDLADALAAGAEAALAASIFHDGTHTIEEVKAACSARGFAMRT